MNEVTYKCWTDDKLTPRLDEAKSCLNPQGSPPLRERVLACVRALGSLKTSLEWINEEIGLRNAFATTDWELEAVLLTDEDRLTYSQRSAIELKKEIANEASFLKNNFVYQKKWTELKTKFQYLKQTYPNENYWMGAALHDIQEMVTVHQNRVKELAEQKVQLNDQVDRIKELLVGLQPKKAPVPVPVRKSYSSQIASQLAKRKFMVLATVLLVGTILAYAYYLHALKTHEAFILRKGIARH